MAEKVTVMKLKVDLQCPNCYRKVKKILCKFPEIRDQVYDEKQNLVIITVVCCSPEKIRDKLCCKGCNVIKSIEIVEPTPPKPKPQGETSQEPPNPEPTHEPDHVIPPPATVPAKPYPCQPVPAVFCCVPCSEGYRGGPCYCGYRRPVPPSPACYCGCGYGYCYRRVHTRCDYFAEENTRGCTYM